MFLGSNDYDGLDGNLILDIYGRFVGVAPEAPVHGNAREAPRVEEGLIKAPTLDEMLALAKPFVADAAWAGFKQTIETKYR